MNKKVKTALCILVAILSLFVGFQIYVTAGRTSRRNHMLAYLEEKGYSAAEIRSIEVMYAFLNTMMGYTNWDIVVEFEDEPGIGYYYAYENGKIVSRGHATGYRNVKLYKDLTHLETTPTAPVTNPTPTYIIPITPTHDPTPISVIPITPTNHPTPTYITPTNHSTPAYIMPTNSPLTVTPSAT